MKRALIVDDDQAVAEVLKEMLQMLEYEVITVSRVKEAIPICESEEFDVVFSDLRMPDMKGDDFLEHLYRKGSPMAKRFFIITGAEINENVEKRIQQLGGKLLRKPFYLNDIITALSRL